MKKTLARKPRIAAKKKAAPAKVRGNPGGPPKRGRPHHGTVDSSPDLRAIVKELYYAHPEWSIEQKLSWIHDSHPEFRTLSWSALQRWYDKFERHIVEQDTMLSLARALKASTEEDGLMLTSIVGELAQTKVYESFLSEEPLTKDDQVKIMMQSRLNSSAASRERARRSVEKDIRRGAQRVKDDLRKILKGHPDLAERLAKIVDARTNEIVEEATRR
ncbi:MAG TPA: phage protein Gp27 family protein [Thermoanaerobaculia bacterium]|nr:phage protein Gp27 family protein [Thermoanaerobaculia bacterium]